MKRMIILIVACIIVCANLAQSEIPERTERILSPDGKKVAVLYCPKAEWASDCQIDIMINEPEPITVPIVPNNGMYYQYGSGHGAPKWSPDSRFFAVVLLGYIKSDKEISDFLAVYDGLRKGNYISEEDNVFYPLQPRRGLIKEISFTGTKITARFSYTTKEGEAKKKCNKGKGDYLISKTSITKDLSNLKIKEKVAILEVYCEDICGL